MKVLTDKDFENVSENDLRYLNEQDALVVFFKRSAYSFYDTNHQPPSEIVAKLNYKPVLDGISPYVESKAAHGIGEWLLSQNVVECAKYKNGNSGAALAARTSHGNACIIRVPTNFDKSADPKRIDSPLNCNPLWSIHSKNERAVFEYKGQNIEILPFLPVVGLLTKDSPLHAHQHILMTMYNMMGLECRDGVKNDLGLLPDGTPLPVDPDILKFGIRPASVQENFCRQQEILNSVRYMRMRSVAWIKEGGIPAQDVFFGPDYLSSPLKPTPSAGIPQIRPTV